MRWIWLGLAALFAVAAGSVWFAFQSPGFVSGLVGIAMLAIWRAVLPEIAKPMSAEEQKQRDVAVRRGQDDERVRKKLGSLRPDR